MHTILNLNVMHRLNSVLSSLSLFTSYETSNDAQINNYQRYSYSNSLNALCWLSGDSMAEKCYVKWLITVIVKLVWAGYYKAKIESTTFIMTHLFTRVLIFLSVPLCLNASIINHLFAYATQEHKILVTLLTIPSTVC